MTVVLWLALGMGLGCETTIEDSDDTGGGGEREDTDVVDTETDSDTEVVDTDTDSDSDTGAVDTDSDSDSDSDTGVVDSGTDTDTGITTPVPRFALIPDSGWGTADRMGLLSDGTVVLGGTLSNLDLSAHSLGVHAATGLWDAFLMQTDPAGTPTGFSPITGLQLENVVSLSTVGSRTITGLSYFETMDLRVGMTDETNIAATPADRGTAVASWASDLSLEWMVRMDGQVSGVWYNHAPRLSTWASGATCMAGSTPGALKLTSTGGTWDIGSTTSTQGSSSWVMSVDTGGTPTWSKELAATGQTLVFSTAADPTGDCLVAGITQATDLQGEPGDASTNITNTGANTRALFALRYDSTGKATVAFQVDAGEAEDLVYMVAAADADVLVGGLAASNLSLSGGITVPATFSSRTHFLTRVEPSGASTWASTLKPTGSGYANLASHEVQDNGSVLLAYNHSGSVTWTDSVGATGFTTEGADVNGLILLVDASGVLVWSKQVLAQPGSDHRAELAGAAYSASGDVVVVGTISSEATFDSGTSEEFLRSPSGSLPNGNGFVWTFTPPAP